MKLSVILAFAFLAVAVSVHAQEITLAAAADLRPAMDEMISRFQGGRGQSDIHINIRAIYGSSGNFFEQIRSGAPFDLFFSANTDYPKKLESASLIVAGTYYEYARGKIVLLVTANSNLDVNRGLNLLLDPAVKKIAVLFQVGLFMIVLIHVVALDWPSVMREGACSLYLYGGTIQDTWGRCPCCAS